MQTNKHNTGTQAKPANAGNEKNTTQQETGRNDDTTKNSGTAQLDEDLGTEEDGTPVLDEKDLEENHLSEDEADNIEWDEPRGKQ
jgi:hypothetical protein